MEGPGLDADARSIVEPSAAPDAPARPTRLVVSAIDYHTGGEPFRIVSGGIPRLEGRTVLERRRFAHDHLDHLRHLLVDEPRGHADMYGGFVVPPNDDGADLGVVFFHNEGYSTACGHGTIALVTWALESGFVAPTAPETEVRLDVPSGRLTCVARWDGEHATSVRFRNVPSYVVARDVELPTSVGAVRVDVAFGGAFYGSVDVRTLGLTVSRADLPRLIALQRELRPLLDAAVAPVHPEEPELRDTYGVIFWEPADDEHAADEVVAPNEVVPLVQRNVTVFADGEVDRSPCGSGTSARLALLADEGALDPGGALRHLSIVGSVFEGRVVDVATVAGRGAVVTEVEGSAHLSGMHTFVLDPRDPLGTGFLLR